MLIFGGKGLSQVTGAMSDLRRDQDSSGLALSQESSIDLAIYWSFVLPLKGIQPYWSLQLKLGCHTAWRLRSSSHWVRLFPSKKYIWSFISGLRHLGTGGL